MRSPPPLPPSRGGKGLWDGVAFLGKDMIDDSPHMTIPHKIKAEGFIPYKYVIWPYTFKEDTYVNAIEIRPHNRNVVHHCNVGYFNIRKLKGGYDTFITGHVPGGQPMDLRPHHPSDPQVAYKIPGGSSLILQIHYTTTGKEEESLISVGFRFPKNGVDKISHHFILDPHNIAITPGDPMWRLSEKYTIPGKATLLGINAFVLWTNDDEHLDLKIDPRTGQKVGLPSPSNPPGP